MCVLILPHDPINQMLEEIKFGLVPLSPRRGFQFEPLSPAASTIVIGGRLGPEESCWLVRNEVSDQVLQDVLLSDVLFMDFWQYLLLSLQKYTLQMVSSEYSLTSPRCHMAEPITNRRRILHTHAHNTLLPLSCHLLAQDKL